MTRSKAIKYLEPCILDICVWKKALPKEEAIRQCKECYEKNNMRQQEILWCQHFYKHYVSLEESPWYRYSQQFEKLKSPCLQESLRNK